MAWLYFLTPIPHFAWAKFYVYCTWREKFHPKVQFSQIMNSHKPLRATVYTRNSHRSIDIMLACCADVVRCGDSNSNYIIGPSRWEQTAIALYRIAHHAAPSLETSENSITSSLSICHKDLSSNERCPIAEAACKWIQLNRQVVCWMHCCRRLVGYRLQLEARSEAQCFDSESLA